MDQDFPVWMEWNEKRIMHMNLVKEKFFRDLKDRWEELIFFIKKMPLKDYVQYVLHISVLEFFQRF